MRGRLVTHGLAFAAVGSQEPGSEALALTCVDHLKLQSFWDVGANIGHYTWLLKSANPKLRAVLFEPSAQNTELVRATLQRTPLPCVELIAAGAGDCNGIGYLRVDSLAGATSTLDHSAQQTFEEQHFGIPAESISIPVVTIDNERARRARVDLLKVDVEGYEAAVLRGARRTLNADQPVLFIECFHPGHACLEPLQREGYRFVDGDRLQPYLSPGTANFFGFPRRFHSEIDRLLIKARERLQTI